MPLGFYVFAIGLIFAIIGSAKPVQQVGAWPDTTIYFFVGAAVSALGVFLWRKSIKDKVEESLKGGSDATSKTKPINELFNSFAEGLGEYASKMTHFNAEDLHDQTESFIDRYIVPIVDERYQLIHRYGMSHGAEIALEFARGERFLNRVQTAALDGDVAEAHRAFPEAQAAFHSAIEKLQALVK